MRDLAVEDFARLLAAFERSRDLRAVLATANLSHDGWIAAKRRWAKALSSEPALRQRFETLYAEARGAEVPVEAVGVGPTQLTAAVAPTASGELALLAQSAKPPILPSYMKDADTPMADLESTAFMPVLVPSAPLPFEGSTSPERLAEIKAAAASIDGPVETSIDPAISDATVMIPTLLVRAKVASENFREDLSPTLVPDLSLAQYAALTARLRFYGDEHAPTWREFALHSPEARAALVRRFQDRFERDPSARRDFDDSVADLLSSLRRRTLKLP